ncbi:tRNA (adenosine(37)-N6)-threonylcarbamoyltransferase complex ATPase subunit type 1 TsaE [Helicobacter sp. T3_23-1056]
MTKTAQNLTRSYGQKTPTQCAKNADIFCANVADIATIANMILERKERIFVLSGAVGSGKTTLVQAVLSLMQNKQNPHNNGKKNSKQGTKKSAKESSKKSSLDFEDFAFVRASSPTFGIRNEYGKIGSQNAPKNSTNQTNNTDYGSVFHYDLYRIDVDYVLELGLLEWLDDEGWHFIEWGEEVMPLLKQNGFECVEIIISEDLDDLDEVLQNDQKPQTIKNLSATLTPNDSKRFYRFLS